MRDASSALQKKVPGVLDVFLDLDEKLHGLAPIDDAVVIAERDVHHRTDHHLAVQWNRTVQDLVETQNADLREVEDWRTQERAKHTAVGNRERAALQVL